MTQEDLGFFPAELMPALERGQKSPTLDKIDALSATMNIHPLTLLAITCAGTETRDLEKLFRGIGAEVAHMRRDD